jgi:hypothetical protein
MARNAADAARSARPKGENFSASLRNFRRKTVITNCSTWIRQSCSFNLLVSLFKISMLKNFDEMFGLKKEG